MAPPTDTRCYWFSSRLPLPVGFPCVFYLDSLVTGLQYKAALRRGYSSSYLTILAHGGTRGQEVGVSTEAVYQKASVRRCPCSCDWVRVTSDLSLTSGKRCV